MDVIWWTTTATAWYVLYLLNCCGRACTSGCPPPPHCPCRRPTVLTSCPGPRPVPSKPQVDECAEDVIPPTIHVSEYAIGSKWFTNQEYAQNFFLINTFVEDDCQPFRRRINGLLVSQQVSIQNFNKNCAASTATVVAFDVCGNEARDPIMFLYDDEAPTVTLAVAKDKLDEAAKAAALVDVGLAITAEDRCTPNPNVTVRIYSDELYLKDTDSWKARMAQLSRIEAVPGIITGWKLLLAADSFKRCNVGAYACGGTSPGMGNGRVYTIVVCATDEAGQRTCRETTVEVTPKGFKPSRVVNDGKNYLLAEDEINKFRTL